jgi:hypothetical protein
MEEESAVGDVFDLDAADRSHGVDDACEVRFVGSEDGHVADLLSVLDADEVDRA